MAAEEPRSQRSARTAAPGSMPPEDASRLRRSAAMAARAASATSRAAGSTARRVRRATHAQGAGESGLARLIELHVVHAAGDALVGVALAGTLFFSVPSDDARGRVALYLVLTMAPFAIVAPIIGPFLDRFRRGRRWAIGATMAIRAFLCWVMAGAVQDEDLSLYPAALLVLVSSRAYGVARSAAVPRVLPDDIGLVTANSRLALAAVAGLAVAAPIGIGISWFGPEWVLRLAFVVFVVATVLSIRLPARIDSNEGEQEAALLPAAAGLRRGRRVQVGPTIVRALRGNAGLRWFSGFLTMFLAFELRNDPVGGLSDVVAIGVAAVAAAVGSTAGTGLMSVLKARHPERLVYGCVLLAAVAALLAALLWGLATVVVVALVAGLAQQLAKLCLDAVIQTDVPEAVRTSAFARSETLLQLAWVIGGGVGIALPLFPELGLGIACAVLVATLVLGTRVRARP